MKALVVGFGSIGKRHTRILDNLGCKVSVVSRRSVSSLNRYATLESALSDTSFDYIVVSNRTSEHADTLATLAESSFGGRVLVEKPLAKYSTMPPPGLPKTTFVAYNFRFHPLLQDLRHHLGNEKLISVHVYAGQYLPNWRPNRDYRECYSASRAQGGGVLRDLSHELDYVNWLLEGWCRVTALGGHFSDLEIDSDDVFTLLLEMNRCKSVTVHLNYLDRAPHRSIRVNAQNCTFCLNFINGTLSKDGNVISKCELDRDATYRAEHKALMGGLHDNLCTLKESIDVMNLIEAAETSTTHRTWVENE